MKKRAILLALLVLPFLAGCTQNVIEKEPTQVGEKVIEKTKDKSKELYIGDTAVFKDYDFTVLSYHETDELKSNNMFEGDAKAGEYSKFLVVRVKILNTTNESFGLYGDQTITDGKGRKYDQTNYITAFYTDKDIDSTEFRPGIPEEVDVIFEVAGDSTDYYFDYTNSVTNQKYKILLKEKPTQDQVADIE